MPVWLTSEMNSQGSAKRKRPAESDQFLRRQEPEAKHQRLVTFIHKCNEEPHDCVCIDQDIPVKMYITFLNESARFGPQRSGPLYPDMLLRESDQKFCNCPC